MMGAGPSVPTETGQSAFAAIAEIVTILEADPQTDWSSVDIGALAAHLADMDMLMQATVQEAKLADGLEMRIDVTGDGGAAAGRMVPAHAPVLAGETGWMSQAEVSDGGIVWRVTAADAADVPRIQALGFFGLMATGAHHQAHHLAIARGMPLH